MKLTKKELAEMIRAIVKEELQNAIPYYGFSQIPKKQEPHIVTAYYGVNVSGSISID